MREGRAGTFMNRAAPFRLIPLHMSTLNESIVEAAALEWFWELGYAVGHGPHLAPGETAMERASFGAVVLVGRLREAIRRFRIVRTSTPRDLTP